MSRQKVSPVRAMTNGPLRQDHPPGHLTATARHPATRLATASRPPHGHPQTKIAATGAE